MSRGLRVRFTKSGKIRFTSHRDVARIWERGLRRAGLPVAYTEGFSPRPKLSFGFALPTGYESLGEYLDVNLRSGAMQSDVDCERLPSVLDPVLPAGIGVQAVVPLQAGAASLQQAVTSVTWHIELAGTVDAGAARGAVDGVLAAPELMVTRQRKGATIVDDIRSGILSVDIRERALSNTSANESTSAFGVVLQAELATQPRAVRPAELVGALGRGLRADRVVRIQQWTHAGGARQEVIPLPSAATPAGTLEARAS